MNLLINFRIALLTNILKLMPISVFQPLSVKKPFLYLNLDPVTDSPTQETLNMDQSGPNSPCTG